MRTLCKNYPKQKNTVSIPRSSMHVSRLMGHLLLLVHVKFKMWQFCNCLISSSQPPYYSLTNSPTKSHCHIHWSLCMCLTTISQPSCESITFYHKSHANASATSDGCTIWVWKLDIWNNYVESVYTRRYTFSLWYLWVASSGLNLSSHKL